MRCSLCGESAEVVLCLTVPSPASFPRLDDSGPKTPVCRECGERPAFRDQARLTEDEAAVFLVTHS